MSTRSCTISILLLSFSIIIACLSLNFTSVYFRYFYFFFISMNFVLLQFSSSSVIYFHFSSQLAHQIILIWRLSFLHFFLFVSYLFYFHLFRVTTKSPLQEKPCHYITSYAQFLIKRTFYSPISKFVKTSKFNPQKEKTCNSDLWWKSSLKNQHWFSLCDFIFNVFLVMLSPSSENDTSRENWTRFKRKNLCENQKQSCTYCRHNQIKTSTGNKNIFL